MLSLNHPEVKSRRRESRLEHRGGNRSIVNPDVAGPEGALP